MPAYKRKIRLGVIVIMIPAKLGAQGEKGDYIFIPSFGGKSHRGEAPAKLIIPTTDAKRYRLPHSQNSDAELRLFRKKNGAPHRFLNSSRIYFSLELLHLEGFSRSGERGEEESAEILFFFRWEFLRDYVLGT